jgi:hypothetical protein
VTTGGTTTRTARPPVVRDIRGTHELDNFQSHRRRSTGRRPCEYTRYLMAPSRTASPVLGQPSRTAPSHTLHDAVALHPQATARVGQVGGAHGPGRPRPASRRPHAVAIEQVGHGAERVALLVDAATDERQQALPDRLLDSTPVFPAVAQRDRATRTPRPRTRDRVIRGR